MNQPALSSARRLMPDGSWQSMTDSELHAFYGETKKVRMRDIVALADGNLERLAMEIERYHDDLDMLELASALREFHHERVYAIQSAKEKELEQELSERDATIAELEAKIEELRR